jgi:hypothetical protein
MRQAIAPDWLEIGKGKTNRVRSFFLPLRLLKPNF